MNQLSTRHSWKALIEAGEQQLRTLSLPQAESCFREALHEVKKDKNRSPDDLVLCMLSLAKVLYMQEKLEEETYSLYKKSLHILERTHGKRSASIVSTLLTLGQIYENEGDYKKAIKYYDRAIEVAGASQGMSSLAYADGQGRLARSTFKASTSGEYPMSPAAISPEDLYFNALNVTMQQPRLDSDEFLERLLADYIDLMRKKESEGKTLSSAFQTELLKDRVNTLERNEAIAASAFRREVSSRLTNQPGSPVPKSLNTGVSSGVSPIVPSRAMSDFAALEEINKQRVTFYERMIATDINSLGAEHPSVARDLSGLAAVYLSQRKFDGARPLLLRALAIYEKSYSTEAALVKRTRALLELISQEQQNTGQLDNESANEVAAAGYLASLPQIPPSAQKLEIALRLNYLGFLCYCRGQVDKAAKIYSYALAATASSSGQQSLLSATCMSDYSRVLASAGRNRESDSMQINAETILRRALSRKAAQMLR